MDDQAKVSESTWAELAKQLGFSRVSVTKWRKLPNAPAEPDLVAWQLFIGENDLGTGKKASREREDELTKRVRFQNRILAIKAAKDERSVVDRSEVDAMLNQVATKAKTLLYQKLEREMPAKAAGMNAVELTTLGRDIADEIAGILQEGFTAWKEAE